MARWVPATNQSCFLVHLNCYLCYYAFTHNWLRNKHLSIYQYSLTPCSSETRSFCLVLLLDEVRSSSLCKMSYCIVIWAGINGPPQKLQCASIIFVDIQQSLEVLSIVVQWQAKVYIFIQDYGTIWVSTFLLRDCYVSCLHTLPHPTQQGLPMYLLIWTIYFGALRSFGAI